MSETEIAHHDDAHEVAHQDVPDTNNLSVDVELISLVELFIVLLLFF